MSTLSFLILFLLGASFLVASWMTNTILTKLNSPYRLMWIFPALLGLVLLGLALSY